MAWLEVRDSKDKVLVYKPCSSYVLGMIEILHSQMLSGGTYTVDSRAFGADSAAGVTTRGLVVGAGTAAVAIGDSNLGTQIGHGITSGLLSYGSTSFTAATTTGNTTKFTIIRSFDNSSGGAVTVNEVGIKTRAGSTDNVLIERTLVTFTIADGASVTLTYTLGVTV